MFLFCLVFAMSLCASVYMCFVVTCWEGLTSWLLFVLSYCEFVTFPLVSWVRCGTWLYRFLIFAPLLTLFQLLIKELAHDWDFGAYRIVKQRRFRRIYAYARTDRCICCPILSYIWAVTWDFQHWCGMCDQQSLRPACAYAQSDQSLC